MMALFAHFVYNCHPYILRIFMIFLNYLYNIVYLTIQLSKMKKIPVINAIMK